MNLNTICRCCLEQNNQVFDILEKNIQMKFEKCINITLKLNDDLPNKICHQCLKELNISYNFRMKCEESEAILHNFFIIKSDEKFVYQQNDENDDNNLCPEFIVVKQQNDENDDNNLCPDFIVVKDTTSNNSSLSEFKNVALKKEITTSKQKLEEKKEEEKEEEEEEEEENVDEKDDVEFPELIEVYNINMTNDGIKNEIHDRENVYDDNDKNDKNDNNTNDTLKVDDEYFKIMESLLKDDEEDQDDDKEWYTEKNDGRQKEEEEEMMEQKEQEEGDKRESDNDETNSISEDDISKILGYIHKDPKNGLFSCKICSKSYKNRVNVKRHVSSHSRNQSFKCMECKRKFPTSYKLKKHQRSSHSKRSCMVCKEEFKISLPRAYFKHMTSHKNSNDINDLEYANSLKGVAKLCEICNKFIITGCYTSHNEMHKKEETEKRTFECTQCDEAFHDRTTLRTHILSAHENITIIKKKFNYNQQDEMNQSNHNTMSKLISLYKCDLCSKVFKRRADCSAHCRSSHYGEKPYQCDFCGKRYAFSGALNIHRRTHTGEKPYVCSTCNKSFINLQYLKDHVYIHKNEKFPCPICGKDYSSPHNLKYHKRKYHKTTTMTEISKPKKENLTS